MKSSLQFVCRAMALAIGLALLSPATAQTWPSRPIRLIAPFPPGQGVDVLARALAEDLSRTLNTPVIVDNKAGAGGSLGTGLVARSDPDGYTLLVAGTGPIAISQSLYSNIEYNTMRDLAPISNMGYFPLVFCVNADSQIKGIADLIKMAKAEPGKVLFGSSGNGSVYG